MEDPNIKSREDEVIHKYLRTFSDRLPVSEPLPKIIMNRCSGYGDPKYLDMLEYAIKQGRPVTEEDYDKFFPPSGNGVYY